MSHYTSATISSPEPVSPHLHIPSLSPSLLLPQPQAAAWPRRQQQQPAKGKGLAVGLQAVGTRVLVKALALFSPFCREPGPQVCCRLAPGRWLPSLGPLHCWVFNSTSRCSSCTCSHGSQTRVGACRSARAEQNIFSLRSVVIPTNVAMLLRHSEEGELLTYCKSMYFC